MNINLMVICMMFTRRYTTFTYACFVNE